MPKCAKSTTLTWWATYNADKWRSSIRKEEQGGTFYLTHHAVSKGKQEDTKWRIVFDASSHEKNAPFLNDTLEMGPNLLPEIFAMLLRFRLNPVAIVGDIRQAFLQLHLDEKAGILQGFSGIA